MAPHHAASLAGLQDEDCANLLQRDEFAPPQEFSNRWRKRAAKVMALACAVGVGSALLFLRFRAQRAAGVDAWSGDADNVMDEFAKCGDVFSQCAGNGFTGAKCCKAGCVCVAKNGFFSSCKPAFPGGGCDPAAAQGKADSIMKDAIQFQVDAQKDARRKYEALEKTADAAEKLAKLERKTADIATREARAAKEAYAAIKIGNGRKWYKAVVRQGGHAKETKEASDETTDAYNEFSEKSMRSNLVATNGGDALAKAKKLAGPEKQWADNLAQDAHWTPIGGYAPVEASASDDDSGGSETDTSGGGDGLVGGKYYMGG